MCVADAAHAAVPRHTTAPQAASFIVLWYEILNAGVPLELSLWMLILRDGSNRERRDNWMWERDALRTRALYGLILDTDHPVSDFAQTVKQLADIVKVIEG